MYVMEGLIGDALTLVKLPNTNGYLNLNPT